MPHRVLEPTNPDVALPQIPLETLKPSRSHRILLFVVAAAFFVRLAMAGATELFPDETLYAWQSQTMPTAFCPHPPVVLLMTKFGMAIGGKTEWGVRLFSVFLSTLTLLPLWLLARDIGENLQGEKLQGEKLQHGNGKRVAFWSVLTALAIPIYFAFGAITTPDGTQLFFWACALFCAWRALNTQALKWWLATGVAVGAGLFVKYILVLFLPALFACLLLVPQWRPQLKTMGPWASLLVAFALFLPPFLWHEYSNGWITVAYHLGSRQERQLPNIGDILRYQLYHVVYYSPLLYALLIASVVWAWREARLLSKKNEELQRAATLRFLALFAAVPYLFFAVIASVTQRELSREQWDAPAYISAIIALVLWATHPKSSSTRTRWKKAALTVGFAMSLLLVAEGTTSGISRLLGTKPFLTKTIGAREVAQTIDARQNKAMLIHKSNRNPQQNAIFNEAFRADFLVGDNFVSTLSYAFYGNSLPYFTGGRKYNLKYGLLDVLQPLAMDEVWLAKHRGQNALYVAEAHANPKKTERRRAETLGDLSPHFERVSVAPDIVVRRGEFVVKTYHVFQCEGLQSLPGRWSLAPPQR